MPFEHLFYSLRQYTETTVKNIHAQRQFVKRIQKNKKIHVKSTDTTSYNLQGMHMISPTLLRSFDEVQSNERRRILSK